MTSRAVLFDLDGTLVNSEASVARCWDRLAIEAGFDISVLDGLHGIPAKTFIETLLGPDRLNESDHWTQWHLRNECEDVDGVVAIDGVFDLLNIPWLINKPINLPFIDSINDTCYI